MQVTDKGICELVAACGATLNCLVLSGLRHLTDASLLMMQSHAPNMRKIYADGCTGLSLGAFVRLKVQPYSYSTLLVFWTHTAVHYLRTVQSVSLPSDVHAEVGERRVRGAPLAAAAKQPPECSSAGCRRRRGGRIGGGAQLELVLEQLESASDAPPAAFGGRRSSPAPPLHSHSHVSWTRDGSSSFGRLCSGRRFRSRSLTTRLEDAFLIYCNCSRINFQIAFTYDYSIHS